MRCGKGSPAHAGMDPRPMLTCDLSPRLPRTRGDGPFWLWATSSAPGAPPHTRGWTRQKPRILPRQCGSPAHAGMDPRCLRRIDRQRRLPRTRGDGPGICSIAPPMASAPPHTRGWTLHLIGHTVQIDGSPAHAGMDPLVNGASTIIFWLPRTRGDGPSATQFGSIALTAPPHTRGWTLSLLGVATP